MTVQVHDKFFYRGQQFWIAAFTGDGLFVPGAFGVEPVTLNTACLRGYYCTYEIAADVLTIRKLTLRSAEPKEILGGSPHYNAEHQHYTYGRLPEPLPFTGGVLLGLSDHLTGYRTSDYWVLPPQVLRSRFGLKFPFQMYDPLIELVFNEGRLTDGADRSAVVKDFHTKIRDEKWRPDEKEIKAWLESRFFFTDYRDYDGSLY